MICADPSPRKPLAILPRRSHELPSTFLCTDNQLENHPRDKEDKMKETRTGPSENPGSTDEVVRDLEENGYLSMLQKSSLSATKPLL